MQSLGVGGCILESSTVKRQIMPLGRRIGYQTPTEVGSVWVLGKANYLPLDRKPTETQTQHLLKDGLLRRTEIKTAQPYLPRKKLAAKENVL